VRSDRYARVAWGFVVYTVGVIVWGAVVRATLSGDGCGDHWPLCNGEVVPVSPRLETIIELTHRVTSGLAWIGALAIYLWSRRRFEKGSLVRRGAGLGFFFMTTEALVGAGLVIFRMVADNPDTARGYWSGAHLVNTFLLLGALTLHAHWARGGGAIRVRGRLRWAIGGALMGVLALGITGAIAALGDTLFPVDSLSEGFAQDLDPSSHLFLRLRAIHPILALVVTVGILWLAGYLALERREEPPVRALAWTVGLVALAQVGLGFLNLWLLAPTWMQIVHLLVADALWIALVLLGAVTGPSSE